MTGAAGFLGRRLAGALAVAGRSVTGLVHRTAPGSGPDEPSAWTVVRGDLLEPAGYEAALDGVDTVIHAAATTGKAPADRHERVNVEGTRRLLDAARRRRVRRFVYLSSIAVTFTHKARYPYARTKEAAEALVRASGLDTIVVRPTIIVGPGAPVLSALARLARLPVIPVFGDGRVEVQPVFVDDLVRTLIALGAAAGSPAEPVAVGGPERLTIEAFVVAIARSLGRSRVRTVHLPLSLVLPAVALGEAIAFGLMPLTVGQLATFRCDGIAPSLPPVPADAVPRTGVAEMLARSVAP